MVIVLLLMTNGAIAQQIVVDETTDNVAGAPIFQHAAGYAGMVVYDGEEIPWVVLSDVYVFNKLVFKNERQAKKYYNSRGWTDLRQRTGTVSGYARNGCERRQSVSVRFPSA